MAESKGNIDKPDSDKHGNAVESVTETVPHPADASSAPGPYEDLDVNRPPVSTNEPQTPIAQSLVAGAGAPSPEFTPPEEQPMPDEVKETPPENKADEDEPSKASKKGAS